MAHGLSRTRNAALQQAGGAAKANPSIASTRKEAEKAFAKKKNKNHYYQVKELISQAYKYL